MTKTLINDYANLYGEWIKAVNNNNNNENVLFSRFIKMEMELIANGIDEDELETAKQEVRKRFVEEL